MAAEELLQPLRVGAGEDTVVQGLEGNAFPGQLPLDVLMAVDAQLGVVGEVGAELQEEGAEVGIEAIEVELVDRRRALDDPRILLAVAAGALLGAKHGNLFLGLAEEQNAFGPLKALAIFRGDIVFALFFLEGNHRDLLLLDKVINLTQELLGHDTHQR